MTSVQLTEPVPSSPERQPPERVEASTSDAATAIDNSSPAKETDLVRATFADPSRVLPVATESGVWALEEEARRDPEALVERLWPIGTKGPHITAIQGSLVRNGVLNVDDAYGVWTETSRRALIRALEHPQTRPPVIRDLVRAGAADGRQPVNPEAFVRAAVLSTQGERQRRVESARQSAREVVAGNMTSPVIGLQSPVDPAVTVSLTLNDFAGRDEAVAAALLNVQTQAYAVETETRAYENQVRRAVYDLVDAQARVAEVEANLRRAYEERDEVALRGQADRISPPRHRAAEAPVAAARNALEKAYAAVAHARQRLEEIVPAQAWAIPIATAIPDPATIRQDPALRLSSKDIARAVLESPEVKAEFARLEALDVRAKGLIQALVPRMSMTVTLSPIDFASKLMDVVMQLLPRQLNGALRRTADYKVATQIQNQLTQIRTVTARAYIQARNAQERVSMAVHRFKRESDAVAQAQTREDDFRTNENPSLQREGAITQAVIDGTSAEAAARRERINAQVALAEYRSLVHPAETTPGHTDIQTRPDFLVENPSEQVVGYVPAAGPLGAASDHFSPAPERSILGVIADILVYIFTLGQSPTVTTHRERLIEEAANEVWTGETSGGERAGLDPRPRLTATQRRQLAQLMAQPDFRAMMARWDSMSDEDRARLEARDGHLFRDEWVQRQFPYIAEVAESLFTRVALDSKLRTLEDAAIFLKGLQAASVRWPDTGSSSALLPGAASADVGDASPTDDPRRGYQPFEPQAPHSRSIAEASVPALPLPSTLQDADSAVDALIEDYAWGEMATFNPSSTVSDETIGVHYTTLVAAVDNLSSDDGPEFIESLLADRRRLDKLSTISVVAPNLLSRQEGAPGVVQESVFRPLVRKAANPEQAAAVVLAFSQRRLELGVEGQELMAHEAFELGRTFLASSPSDQQKAQFIEALLTHGRDERVVGTLVAMTLSSFERPPKALLTKLKERLPDIVRGTASLDHEHRVRYSTAGGQVYGAIPVAAVPVSLNRETAPEALLAFLERVVGWRDPGIADDVAEALEGADLVKSPFANILTESLKGLSSNKAFDQSRGALRELSAGGLSTREEEALLTTLSLSLPQLTSDQLRQLAALRDANVLDSLALDRLGQRALGALLRTSTDAELLDRVMEAMSRATEMTVLDVQSGDSKLALTKTEMVEIARQVLQNPAMATQAKLELIKTLSRGMHLEARDPEGRVTYDPRAAVIGELLTSLGHDPVAFGRAMESLIDRNQSHRPIGVDRLHAVLRAAVRPEGESQAGNGPLVPLLPGGGSGTATNDVRPLARLLAAAQRATAELDGVRFESSARNPLGAEYRAMIIQAQANAMLEGVGEHQQAPLAVMGLFSHQVRQMSVAGFGLLASGATGDTMDALRQLDPTGKSISLLTTFGFGPHQWDRLAALGERSPDQVDGGIREGFPFTGSTSHGTLGPDSVGAQLSAILAKLTLGDGLDVPPENYFWYGGRVDPNGPPRLPLPVDVQERQAYFSGGMMGALPIIRASAGRAFSQERIADSTSFAVGREMISFSGLFTDLVGKEPRLKVIAKYFFKVAEVAGKIAMHYVSGQTNARSVYAEYLARSLLAGARQEGSSVGALPAEDFATHTDERSTAYQAFLSNVSSASSYGRQFDGESYPTTTRGNELRTLVPRLVHR